ncbi:DUF594 family protein [Quillaja saponaria]|uniref:DUF594 family protein n=1 Tax=Quillaja saponaria TaxID=32244 RepID=A0AAD7KVT8_QUISA|nr:DUF594 family protein [Quillaja saponaria]
MHGYHSGFLREKTRLLANCLSIVNVHRRKGWKSHEFFLQRNASDALRVLESELNFIYELFHTKASIKGVSSKSDIAITYTLLIGSICLESIAILMLILSDWTLISLLQGSTTDLHPKRSFIANKLCEFLSLMNSKDHNFHPPLFSSRTLFRRWSESVLGYNLIDYSIKEGLRINIRESRKENKQGFVDGRNLTICTFTTEHPAWNIIFQELKTKSNGWKDLETGKNKIRECRGDWVLKEHPDSLYRKLDSFVVDYPFDQSILLWHIATELHFTIDKEPEDEKTKQYRDCSKLIWDYMSYLIVMQPQMISSVAGMAKLSFQDTCGGAVRCLSKWRFNRGEKKGSKRKIEKKEACKKILQDSEVNPLILTLFGKFGEDHEQLGDNHNIELTGETKSVLLDACSLAKELEGLNDGDRWEIMCKVWVEMLSYAAIHCRATLHFQQLSKGWGTHYFCMVAYYSFWHRRDVSKHCRDY